MLSVRARVATVAGATAPSPATTAEPTAAETTAEPTAAETTAEPTAAETTAEPTAAETTAEPTAAGGTGTGGGGATPAPAAGDRDLDLTPSPGAGAADTPSPAAGAADTPSPAAGAADTPAPAADATGEVRSRAPFCCVEHVVVVLLPASLVSPQGSVRVFSWEVGDACLSSRRPPHDKRHGHPCSNIWGIPMLLPLGAPRRAGGVAATLSPDAAPGTTLAPVAGDENGDGLVNSADTGVEGDTNGDGVVDDADTGLVGDTNGELSAPWRRYCFARCWQPEAAVGPRLQW